MRTACLACLLCAGAALNLRPPGLGAPQPKVIVLIRTFLPQLPLVPKLIQSLARQHVHRCEHECVSFVLVPTEAGSLAAFRDLASNLSSAYDVAVPPALDEALFTSAGASQPRCLPGWESTDFARSVCESFRTKDPACFATWRGLDRNAALSMMQKICAYQNYVHYAVVDKALDYAVARFGCRPGWLLVTNGDNEYHPDFLGHTTKQKHQLVGTDFVSYHRNAGGLLDQANQSLIVSEFHAGHAGQGEETEEGHAGDAGQSEEAEEGYADGAGQSEEAEGPGSSWRLGEIDLGAAIVDFQSFCGTGARFLNSLPRIGSDPYNIARLRSLHDADFWFFRRLISHFGFQHHIVHRRLFVHK